MPIADEMTFSRPVRMKKAKKKKWSRPAPGNRLVRVSKGSDYKQTLLQSTAHTSTTTTTAVQIPSVAFSITAKSFFLLLRVLVVVDLQVAQGWRCVLATAVGTVGDSSGIGRLLRRSRNWNLIPTTPGSRLRPPYPLLPFTARTVLSFYFLLSPLLR